MGRGSMKVFCEALITAAILASVAAPEALAETAGDQSAYVVTYIEVIPSAETEVANLLRRVAAASRVEPGNLRYDVLQQIDRRSQFGILEAWSSAKAFEVHAGVPAMKQ